MAYQQSQNHTQLCYGSVNLPKDIALIVLLALFIPIFSVINAMFAYALVKTNKGRYANVSIMFLVVAVVDLLSFLLYSPNVLYNYVVNISEDNRDCNLGSLAFNCPQSAINIVAENITVLISITRFIQIRFNNFYKRWLDNRKFLMIVLLVSAVLAIGPVIHKMFFFERHTVSLMFGIIGLVLYLFSFINSILLVVFVRKHASSSVAARSLTPLPNQLSRQKSTIQSDPQPYDQAVTKTITILSVWMTITWTPLIISNFLVVFDPSIEVSEWDYVTDSILEFSLTLFMMSVGMNGFIYMLRNSKMRKFYRKKFTRNRFVWRSNGYEEIA